ncbi:Protein cft1 [Astathelohania contejeani]|uniref:Protein cft1 n=1 Tax=Astathelohania contejeani TaxID=164912 RepID=A0ABQ7HZS9_9MICR|nr:Protein cft1 [Thelohania contejeani]
MSFIFAQQELGNPVQGSIMGNFIENTTTLLTYHNDTLKLWTNQLIKEKRLYYPIQQIEKIQGKTKDFIVILFKFSRISIIEYNPCINDYETIGLKLFDSEESHFLRISYEFGILKTSNTTLSFFSLKPNTFDSFTISNKDIHVSLNNIKDIQFLDNSTTFAILYDSTPHSYINTDSYNTVIIVTINIQTKKICLIDQFNVHSHSQKLGVYRGGLAVFALNSITFYSNGNIYELGLNAFYINKYNYKGEILDSNIIIDNSYYYIRENNILLINGNGIIYSIRFFYDNKKIQRVIIEKILVENLIPSCVASYGKFLFVGSLFTDSIMYEIEVEEDHNFQGIVDDIYSENSPCVLNGEILDLASKDIQINPYPEFVCMDDYAMHEIYVPKTIKIKLKQIYALKNYGIIGGMCATLSNDKICTGGTAQKPMLYKLKAKVDFQYIRTVKVRGYDSLFYANGIFLLSNERESILVEWKDELIELMGDYFYESETLLFTKFKMWYLQVTASYMVLLDKEYKKCINYEFETKIKNIKYSNEIFLVLTNNNALIKCCIADNNISTVVLFNDGVKQFEISDDGSLIIINDKGIEMYNITIKDITPCFKSSMLFGFPQIINNIMIDTVLPNNITELALSTYKNRILVLLRTNIGQCVIYEYIYGLFRKLELPRNLVLSKTEKKSFFVMKEFVYIKSSELCNIEGYFLFITSDNIFIHESLYRIDFITTKESNLLIYKNTLASFNLFNYNYENRFIIEEKEIKRYGRLVCTNNNFIVVASIGPVDNKEDDYTNEQHYIDLYNKDYLIDEYKLMKNEFVCDIKSLVLHDKQSKNEKTEFIIACTSCLKGEDNQTRGRLLVFEIMNIVPEKDKPYICRKLKVLGIENTKSPIIQCEEVRGNIVLAMGTRIMVYEVDRSEGINAIAFHDLHTFTSSIAVIKNYIIASDIYRGISFFYFQSKPVQIHLVATSDSIKNVISVEYSISNDDNTLDMISTDYYGNIHIYTYSPYNLLSKAGTKLVKRAEISTGVNKIQSFSNLYNPLCYTQNGIIMNIKRIKNQDKYQTLLTLQNRILMSKKYNCGINYKNYGIINKSLRVVTIKGIINESIIREFLCMNEMAQKTISEGLDNLYDIINELII